LDEEEEIMEFGDSRREVGDVRRVPEDRPILKTLAHKLAASA